MTSEPTYSTEIRVVSTLGDPRDPFWIGVQDAKGNIQSFPIRTGGGILVTGDNGDLYLPVVIFEVDRKTSRYLVKMPYEADSGSRRIWVHISQFRRVKVPGSYRRRSAITATGMTTIGESTGIEKYPGKV